MRKIFPFEISVATQDRSKTFQYIILALFSFCIAVILVAAFQHLALQEQQQVVKRSASIPYSGVELTPSLEGFKR